MTKFFLNSHLSAITSCRLGLFNKCMFHTCHNRGRHQRSHSSSLSLAFLPALETHGLLNSRCSPSLAWDLPPQAVTAKGGPAASKTEVEPVQTGPRSRNSAAQAHGPSISVCSHSKDVGIGLFFQTRLQFLRRRSLFTLERTLILSHSACVPTSSGLQSGLLPSQTPSASLLLSLLSFTFPHTILGAAR